MANLTLLHFWDSFVGWIPVFNIFHGDHSYPTLSNDIFWITSQFWMVKPGSSPIIYSILKPRCWHRPPRMLGCVVASLLKLDTPIFDHELDGFFLATPWDFNTFGRLVYDISGWKVELLQLWPEIPLKSHLQFHLWNDTPIYNHENSWFSRALTWKKQVSPKPKLTLPKKNGEARRFQSQRNADVSPPAMPMTRCWCRGLEGHGEKPWDIRGYKSQLWEIYDDHFGIYELISHWPKD